MSVEADQAIDVGAKHNASLHRILTYLLAEAGGDTTALEARIAVNETNITTVQAIGVANSSSISDNETAIALNTAKQTGLILGWAYVHQSTALVAFKPPIADSSGSAGDGVDVEQFVADAVTYDGLAVDAGTYIVAGYHSGGTTSANPSVSADAAFPTDAAGIVLVADVIYGAPSVNTVAFGVYSPSVASKIWVWPDSAVSGIGLLVMKLL